MGDGRHPGSQVSPSPGPGRVASRRILGETTDHLIPCAMCGRERARANLTLVDGALCCPRCLSWHAEQAMAKQRAVRE